MKYFKEKYDAIIIGGALAGLASAISLGSKGKKVLVLEQHNLPGGLATSFVRGGIEMEATLHEMMSIGPEDAPLKVRQFFDDMGVKINWLRVPEAYRLVLPNENLDITLHAGYEKMANEIEEKCPGSKEKVSELMNLCDKVYKSVGILSTNKLSKGKMLKEHSEFVKTAGYSAMEVIDTFNLDKKVIEILSPYWIYVGCELTKLPFTVWAVLMADYFTGGSYICSGYSHEMSLAMANRAEELGAQIEYCTKVDKILVKNGKVTGVKTIRGDVINTDYVVCGTYPNKVYSSMIEPLSEVPKKAIKSVNAKQMGVTCFSVVMILDASPEELNIKDYSVFSGNTMDTEKIWEDYAKLEPYEYITTICTNIANPNCMPKGYTSLSITALPRPESWFGVTPDNYYETKRRLARGMIEHQSKLLGVNLFDHIVEIEIESPMTIAHYTGAWNGGVYGYKHCQDDNIIARIQMEEEEKFIKGLEFAGAHAISGNGMGPAISNGRKAAKNVLDAMAMEEEK